MFFQYNINVLESFSFAKLGIHLQSEVETEVITFDLYSWKYRKQEEKTGISVFHISKLVYFLL